MPFYDGHKHIIDDLEGAEMQTISHLNNWWAPADQGKARLFKTLTQKFFTQTDKGAVNEGGAPEPRPEATTSKAPDKIYLLRARVPAGAA